MLRALLLATTLLAGCPAPPASSPTPTAEPGCAAPAGEVALDPWGGDLRASQPATGFFEAAPLCGRWWLWSPDGHPLRSFGVNSMRPEGDFEAPTGRRPYGEAVDALYDSDEAWAAEAGARMRRWGLNTVGSWSAAELLAPHAAVAINLSLSGGDWQSGAVADWWDPAWAAAVAATVADRVTPWVGDPRVLGWFLDNELRWGPDWRGTETLLQLYLALPAEAPGKQAAVDLLLSVAGGEDALAAGLGRAPQSRATLLATSDWPELDPDASALEPALTAAFLSAAAERYFRTTTGAIRAVDPDHLVLGNREVALMTRAEVYDAAVPYLDVVSINHYVFLEGVDALALRLSSGLDPADWFAALHAGHDVPILISEFGFRAVDAGVPSDWPPQYPRLPDQAARAAAFDAYAQAAQATPWIVGWHWFEWADQPPGGRFDGENNNWGVVGLDDAPWVEVTEAMAARTAAGAADLLVPP